MKILTLIILIELFVIEFIAVYRYAYDVGARDYGNSVISLVEGKEFPDTTIGKKFQKAFEDKKGVLYE